MYFSNSVDENNFLSVYVAYESPLVDSSHSSVSASKNNKLFFITGFVYITTNVTQGAKLIVFDANVWVSNIILFRAGYENTYFACKLQYGEIIVDGVQSVNTTGKYFAFNGTAMIKPKQ